MQELINRNLRFVISVAKQYIDYGVPLGDLINEGNYGLIKAANRFEPNMGFKFISYAVWWIRKHITEHLTNYSRTVRIPANKINSLARLNKKFNMLEQKLGKTPDIEEIKLEYGDSLNANELKSFECLDIMNMDSLDRGLSDELRDLRWADFARIYNGASYRLNNYDTKIATAYDKFIKEEEVLRAIEAQTPAAESYWQPMDDISFQTPSTETISLDLILV